MLKTLFISIICFLFPLKCTVVTEHFKILTETALQTMPCCLVTFSYNTITHFYVFLLRFYEKSTNTSIFFPQTLI